jgi:hypothetical protein
VLKFRNITFTPFIVFVSPNINISSYTTKVILSEIQFSRLFSYTLKHYVVYFYEYLCKLKDMRKVFEKNFLSDNTIVQETNGDCTFVVLQLEDKRLFVSKE